MNSIDVLRKSKRDEKQYSPSKCCFFSFRQELLEDAIKTNRSFPTWDGVTVVAWLEVGLHSSNSLLIIFLFKALGENASMVCRSMSSEC